MDFEPQIIFLDEDPARQILRKKLSQEKYIEKCWTDLDPECKAHKHSFRQSLQPLREVVGKER